MTKWLQLAAVACVMLFALGLAGCSEEGPAEKAGKKIDQAVEQAGEQMQDLKDKAKKALE
ncbi:hypothetical protein Dde_0316 [Oleidesulfovibrio alaskensis G20]|jgi:PBP1b-binding outer membrane lipoprotein LpoB|uniref:Lipoprotein n=1 Tax=Oleidesulfovibrio alaskensis (strain ATCC BAA-1058 / DSM 17464 / G20) TaxID=207559 RepID=Q316M9_OLEA2|nr:hypothetical protein [Oleidesulfovibrio alaskensis]ABB37117.1 hypothetical protein Dde_0316 [Oleidesulfovibrio alaskensis G20]MBG0774131.1 transport-associated protein [Oleidesulfovibrio alaskensis]MBL3582923.1 transport-associated protein [Oleidesulfovibrio alaskensis]